jgi:nucleotide-binding universal stress UspA family protein
VIDPGAATIADGIHREALRRNAGLIVMGRGGSRGTFTGMWSRLYPVIRDSTCPVLSI